MDTIRYCEVCGHFSWEPPILIVTSLSIHGHLAPIGRVLKSFELNKAFTMGLLWGHFIFSQLKKIKEKSNHVNDSLGSRDTQKIQLSFR